MHLEKPYQYEQGAITAVVQPEIQRTMTIRMPLSTIHVQDERPLYKKTVPRDQTMHPLATTSARFSCEMLVRWRKAKMRTPFLYANQGDHLSCFIMSRMT